MGKESEVPFDRNKEQTTGHGCVPASVTANASLSFSLATWIKFKA